MTKFIMTAALDLYNSDNYPEEIPTKRIPHPSKDPIDPLPDTQLKKK